MKRRLSRPCYDKYHRCPGWAGGGLKYPRVERCHRGYIAREAVQADTWSPWRLYGCTSCNVLVLPFYVRWVDPTWWVSEIRYRVQRTLFDIKLWLKGR